MMIKTRPIPNHKATKNLRSSKFSRQKRRQIVKYDIEEWYKFSLDVQEKLCNQYHVILLNYLPFKRMKYRKWHKRIAKSQKMINAGISGISKASSQFTETMDGIFKGLDGAFGPKKSETQAKENNVMDALFGKKSETQAKENNTMDILFGKKSETQKGSETQAKENNPMDILFGKKSKTQKEEMGDTLGKSFF